MKKMIEICNLCHVHDHGDHFPHVHGGDHGLYDAHHDHVIGLDDLYNNLVLRLHYRGYPDCNNLSKAGVSD